MILHSIQISRGGKVFPVNVKTTLGITFSGDNCSLLWMHRNPLVSRVNFIDLSSATSKDFLPNLTTEQGRLTCDIVLSWGWVWVLAVALIMWRCWEGLDHVTQWHSVRQEKEGEKKIYFECVAFMRKEEIDTVYILPGPRSLARSRTWLCSHRLSDLPALEQQSDWHSSGHQLGLCKWWQLSHPFLLVHIARSWWTCRRCTESEG